MATRTHSTLAALVLLVAACPVSAHDFWIEPSSYRPAANESIRVGLRVGDNFLGQAVLRTQKRIVQFATFDSGGQRPIVGRDGADPAGFARFTAGGLAILAYRSDNAFVELEGPKFDAYLAEKGLDAIIQKRRDAGETGRKTREAYSRCAKALINVHSSSSTRSGSSADPRTDEATSRNGETTPNRSNLQPARDAKGGDHPIGLTLEIVAESNPYACKPGDELSFQVLHAGQPLPNALVTATRKGSADGMLSARTDKSGRVRFGLADSGVWLIATVHMTDAPAGVDARWQSLWASETFELGDLSRVVQSPAASTTRPAATVK